MNLKHTVQTIILEICIWVPMNLRRVMSLEQSGKDEKADCWQVPTVF